MNTDEIIENEFRAMMGLNTYIEDRLDAVVRHRIYVFLNFERVTRKSWEKIREIMPTDLVYTPFPASSLSHN